MFTGIIQHVARIAEVAHHTDSSRIAIPLGPLANAGPAGAPAAKLGDSIAVDGCCLTIAALTGELASFDLSRETLARTTFARAVPGRRVNLEPALRLGDVLGGHLVSGHVDGLGRVLRIAREGTGDSVRIELWLPSDILVVEKGSLAVDGISLTVFACRADPEGGTRCAIAVIPHTLAHTTLADRQVGDAVHLEADQIGRYVEAVLRRRSAGSAVQGS